MWTARERIEAVFAGEKPDRVPVFECMCNDAVLEYFGILRGE